MTDTDIRELWMQRAIKVHAWHVNAVPDVEVSGRFSCQWHEEHYQEFKAGYIAANK